MQDKNLFITLLSINLITDILDGWIARTFKLETEFGARLDSIADVGTMLLAFSGLFFLEMNFVVAHRLEFGIMLVMFLSFEAIALLRFKRFPSLHLYSAKVTGYLQGIFIFSYFIYQYVPWYFYFMVGFTCLSYLEELIVIITIPQLRSNCKGLYWMYKERKTRA